MLVKLYHPDRFANEPDKLETFSKLTSAINLARDTGDGNIFDQCIGDNGPNEIGAYLRSGNKWMVSKNAGLLKPSILGLTWYSSDWHDGHVFLLRNQLSWLAYGKDLI